MEFLESRDPQVFHALVQRAHADNPLLAGVGAYSPEDYAGMQLFVTKDGRAGFALKGDEILSPFTSQQGSLGMQSILQLATELGGRRLKYFDTVHPRTASQMGFKAVGRSPFDNALAPEDLDPEVFQDFNGGYPDILHMVWDPEMATQYKPTHGKFFETAERAAQEQQRAIHVIRNRPSTKNSKLNY